MAVRHGKQKEVNRYEPPQSVDAEQAVLGSVLKDPESLNEIVDFFNSEDYFYFPKHRVIFRAVLTLYEKSEPCDITTVAEELTQMDQLEKIGGRLYLVDLIDGVASTANVKSYADIVIEKSILRNLINISSNITQSCYDQDDDVGNLLDTAEQKIFTIAESRLRKGFTRVSELLPQSFEQLENYQNTQGGLVGVPTGFAELDKITAGLHNSNFIVVAGRPSMGKTAFALNIAEYVALEEKKSVGIFSIEMSQEQLVMRLLCGRARLSQHLLRTGKLKDSEWVKLTHASGPLSEADIFIDDSAFLSTLEMRAKARRLKARHNIDLLIIDYIQMMSSPGRVDNRQQEMAMISRSIKGLAKELEIPIVALSQLSRNVESRPDKRPQLSDLRESGAIEQDADVVMFVYRPEFYLSHLPHDDPKLLEVKGRAEIIVSKQRNGPTGKIDLTFVKEFVRFEDISYRPGDAIGDMPMGDIEF